MILLDNFRALRMDIWLYRAIAKVSHTCAEEWNSRGGDTYLDLP